MSIKIEEGDLGKLIMIGDRVLVKPRKPESKTKSGLYLPPGVHENEKISSGYIVKVGPGIPIPNLQEVDEVLMDQNQSPKFIPTQFREGDVAVYLQNNGHEIQFNDETYLILNSASVLMVVRDEDLFN